MPPHLINVSHFCFTSFTIVVAYSCSYSSHEAFYLIMNVAVGGTNGWFPDGNEKPWLDGSQSKLSGTADSKRTLTIFASCHERLLGKEESMGTNLVFKH